MFQTMMDEHNFLGEWNFELNLYFKYEYLIELNFEYVNFFILSCLNMAQEGIGDLVYLRLMFVSIERILEYGAAI